MRPLISYYGGKQNLLNELLPLIPEHNTYVEPFFGGGALFFAKPPSQSEVINDTNEMLINFYRVVQTQKWDFIKMVKGTMYSRAEHSKAKDVYNGKVKSTALEKAWAVYVCSLQGFSSKLGEGWGYEICDLKSCKIFNNKKKSLSEIIDRLSNVQVEYKDALEVIKTYDKKDAFFYLDPPYYNSDCGHYKGYTKDDYQNIIDLLLTIKGKFMLSSYPNEVIDSYDWTFRKDIEKELKVNGKQNKGKIKTEVIITNYLVPQLKLF